MTPPDTMAPSRRAPAIPLQPPRPRRAFPVDAWRSVSSGATWASLVVVVCLWVAHRGVQDVVEGSLAERLASLGRLAALVSSDLLLIQVLLMARLPWVERAYGQDELTRRHRLVGFLSFDLMLAHIGLTVAGYAALSGANPLAEAWDMVVTYPGMLLAALGTGMLVLVVGLSIRAARARLRYESWHLIHLYAYLGVGLALPHQLWTGTDFADQPVARIYWWGLWLAAVAAILVWRVGLPLWRSAVHGLHVESVVRETPGQVSINLRGRRLDRLGARAGQFMVFRFLDGEGWTRGHPFSLSAAPTRSRMRITVKDLGDGSHALVERLQSGTSVAFEGPYGHLTSDARTRQRLLFLACGIGITPLRALLEELQYEPGEATLVYRARNRDDVLFADELDRLARERGVTVHYLLGPRLGSRSFLHRGARGWTDAAALRRLVPDVEQRDVFLCGPDAWLDAAEEACRDAGVDPAQIHSERFAW